MSSIRRILVGTAALVLGSAASFATAQAQSDERDGGAIHFFFTPSYEQKTGHVPNLGTGQMEYFGGKVFSSVEVVSVMWGSNVNSQTVAAMPGYYKAIVNSTFLDMLEEYSTKHVKTVNGHKSSNQTIERGTFQGQVQITPKNQSTQLTNHDVWRELDYQIKQGNLPPQGPNVLYMIYFPSNVSITAFGLTSCSAFGAYHFTSSSKQRKSDIFYGVMPDCGYSLASHEIVSAHEFAEATTDNFPTPGSNPHFPQAWNNASGAEIGDLCEGTQGELITKKTTYYVQQVYLNSTSGCSTGNYKSP